MAIHELTAPPHAAADDGLDAIPSSQTWHAREAEANRDQLSGGIPIRAEGQDLSGGHQVVLLTKLLSQSQQPTDILVGRDYDRLEVGILVIGAPVILCDSKETAESVWAQINGGATGPLNGPGAWVPAGVERRIRTCAAVWVALGSTTAAQVSLTVARRLGVESPDLSRP